MDKFQDFKTQYAFSAKMEEFFSHFGLDNEHSFQSLQEEKYRKKLKKDFIKKVKREEEYRKWLGIQEDELNEWLEDADKEEETIFTLLPMRDGPKLEGFVRTVAAHIKDDVLCFARKNNVAEKKTTKSKVATVKEEPDTPPLTTEEKLRKMKASFLDFYEKNRIQIKHECRAKLELGSYFIACVLCNQFLKCAERTSARGEFNVRKCNLINHLLKIHGINCKLRVSQGISSNEEVDTVAKVPRKVSVLYF